MTIDLKFLFVRWAWIYFLRSKKNALCTTPSERIDMRNRSMFQRQRDISPPSTRIKIKSRQFKTWGRNRFKTDISPLSARIKIKAGRLRYDVDYLLFSLSYKATSRYANSFFIPSHSPLEYSYTSSRIFVMKYLATTFSLVALIALVPALVVADDGESNDSDDWSGNHHHPHGPRPNPQVLWGQCTSILNIDY